MRGRGPSWLDSILFAIAQAVGAGRSFSDGRLGWTLSAGAIRHVARKVLVKRLAAIHDLGSWMYSAPTKTGTLRRRPQSAS
jgi:Mg2+-importing ATPase